MVESQHLVVKHNKLVNNTRYNLSMQEQKIILYLIASIKPDATELEPVQFSIIDFCNLAEIKEPKGHYTDIKRYCDGLLSKRFSIEDEDKILCLNWMSFVEVSKNSGTVEMQLNSKLIPYLLNIRNNFTKYELYYILRFKSKYSIRLYELFKSYEFTRKVEIDIDDLQKMLDSNYERFYDFKRKVIEVALREINKETDINVDVEYIKQGRSYKKIKFTIKNWSTQVVTEQ